MTGPDYIESIQSHNPSFLTTLQATLEILDDISSVMEENTYLTLVNELQILYSIHNAQLVLLLELILLIVIGVLLLIVLCILMIVVLII